MQIASLDIAFRKRALHMYRYMYKYVCIQRAHFQNTIYKIGIDIAHSFFGMALIAFRNGALHLFYTCCVWDGNGKYSAQSGNRTHISGIPGHYATITPCRLPDVTTIRMPTSVYAAPCLRGQCRLLHTYKLCLIEYFAVCVATIMFYQRPITKHPLYYLR